MNKKTFSVVFSQPSGSFIPKEIRTHCYLASLLRKQFMSQPRKKFYIFYYVLVFILDTNCLHRNVVMP